MKTFNLKSFLSENREIVISKYATLQANEFFNGISLKNFMLQILSAMERNNVKSEKTAISKLPFLMGDVFCENTIIECYGFISNKPSENISKFNR